MQTKFSQPFTVKRKRKNVLSGERPPNPALHRHGRLYLLYICDLPHLHFCGNFLYLAIDEAFRVHICFFLIYKRWRWEAVASNDDCSGPNDMYEVVEACN